MTIKQVSVFIENKTGRTQEVTKLLAENDIDILAFSLADNPEFGILRLIVSDVDTAVKVLREHNRAVILTDVIRMDLTNTTGSLERILAFLAEKKINIEYMYALQGPGVCSAIIRPYDFDNCKDILNDFD